MHCLYSLNPQAGAEQLDVKALCSKALQWLRAVNAAKASVAFWCWQLLEKKIKIEAGNSNLCSFGGNSWSRVVLCAGTIAALGWPTYFDVCKCISVYLSTPHRFISFSHDNRLPVSDLTAGSRRVMCGVCSSYCLCLSVHMCDTVRGVRTALCLTNQPLISSLKKMVGEMPHFKQIS